MDRLTFTEKIKRNLGHPYVKVELAPEHFQDAIDEMIGEYKIWAIENIVLETYITLPLSVGQNVYKIPENVQTVVSMDDRQRFGGINTLFTLDNYLYNKGIIDPFGWSKGGSTLLDYHIALDFIETIHNYFPSKFTYEFLPHMSSIKITPTPNITDISEGRIVLLRTFALMGTNTESSSLSAVDQEIFSRPWALKYATALCKIKLGYIRRKFSGGFQSLGNTGIDLDGDSLISEGKEEQERLLELLKLEENYHGMPILMG